MSTGLGQVDFCTEIGVDLFRVRL